MISIVKNGKDKKYFAKCHKCASELEYEHSDVTFERSRQSNDDIKTIVCPECGSTLIISMLTKEESEKEGSRYGFGFGCRY